MAWSKLQNSHLYYIYLYFMQPGIIALMLFSWATNLSQYVAWHKTPKLISGS